MDICTITFICPGTVGCRYVRDGKNVVPDVCNVLDKIMDFSEKVLSGSSWELPRKPPKDMFAIGIDASFLGPLFVHLALQTDPQAVEFAKRRHLCFVKKEEMDQLDKFVKNFGIDPNYAFAFWDLVGGHYSDCAPIDGVLLPYEAGERQIWNKWLIQGRVILRDFIGISRAVNLGTLMTAEKLRKGNVPRHLIRIRYGPSLSFASISYAYKIGQLMRSEENKL
ncbi:hypothetical protein J1N35_036204 [Gossypium stocksii]|uniref:Uncharacterized protein n=1 Tax=Gossypium stocksii TaxID=47602 RepID=A0A9D3UI78_9ROSI|nr:hypothetical protein J1N35_036204 [Gossypium stocksii]